MTTMRRKPHNTRAWLNSDTSMTSYVATHTDDHGADIEISDCSRTIHLHSYSMDRKTDRTKYVKKLRVIVEAIENQIWEINNRWQ